MSGEELQDENIDYVEPDFEESQEDLTEEPEADLAPASEQAEAKPKVKFTPEQQAVFDQEIAKKTFQRREAERKAAQLEAELASIKSKQSEVAPAPVVPEYPDAFDPQFDQKVAQRDEAIRQRAAHDAQLAYLAQQANTAQQKAREESEREITERAIGFTKKAVSLGVTPQELQYAGHGVASYLEHMPELVDEIVDDEVGPLITTYLAANVGELEKISLMKPIQAARYIESQIKPKLSARKPRISNAPDPVQKLGGNAPQGNSYFKHSKGAKFE